FEGDSSAVSLRDVKRCLGLISWFAKYWPGGPRARTHISLFGRSLVLAVAHVYLYRLSSVQMRAQFWSKVAAITKDFGRKVDQIRCAELGQSSFPQAVLKRVQKNFSDTFTVDTGIAMNEALTENIYVIVVCILNKIPVFVVGKPGTSKTLALQVIASNLQGAQSPHATWRRFPAVYLFQYQCSPLSTAKSIHFQFEAAKSYQASAEDVITVLLLDEVGLAEHSPDMPLKVLHYMLVDPPIGIVGLSNWTLDSSKMNRAICLQRPEPSVDDMMLTGQNIVCALDGAGVPLGEDDPPPVPTLARQNSKPGTRRMSPWLINLSRAFHKIYRAQSEHSNGRREFIGMRDYYCLLKMFRNDVGMPVDDTGTNVDEHTISVPSLLYNVSRNLGGKPNDMQHILSTFFVECFRQRMEVEKLNFDDIKSFVPTSTRLIQDSLQALHNRHLMLLTRNSAALSLLFSCDILRESDVTVLIGSRFQKDLAELRLIQQINEIKNAMLDGRVVVLLNHDSIYESLYDVLNQRYVTRTDPVTGKVKRMLRLAIGPRSQLCPVNDGFKIVVVVEQYHAYDNLDLPLLNRFEKQVFLYDSVLNAHEKACVASLTEWVESLLGETDLGYPDELFAGYHAETIPSLILYLTKKMPVDGSTQSPTDNVDVICAAKLALLRISLPVINIDLLATLHSELGLFPECSKVDTEFSKHASLTVAMTHSPVGHFSACKLAHQMSSHAETLEVLELQLSLISSEKQITDFLEGYYSIESSSCQNKMLCILCDPQENDLSIISHVKYLCVKYNMLYKRLFASLPPSTQQSHFRHVSIIVHLPPGMCTTVGRRDYTIDFQLPWGYLFIDDIRPMSSESINEMNELTSKSAFDLCRSGGILNLFDTIVFKYQSALARCVTPAITSKNMSFRTGVRNAQIVKFLMCFPEFMLFLQEAILACLESCCHAGFDSPNRPPFHVQIACSDPFVAGTLKESLLLALESLIVQSLSHIFRNLDRNFNFNSLAPVVGNYAHSVSEAPLNLSETESSTVNKWLSLCLRLVDIGSIGRSCSLYSPSELHQADCSVANTGLHDDGLVCQFPFSERIMRLIGTDETRQNVEKVTENSIDGGSADNMIPPLRAILSSFLGEQFWASSILSNVDNDASKYSYGLVIGLLSTISRKAVANHLSETDIDVLMHGIVIPFRSIRAAAAVVCEMRLDCTSGESQQSIEKYMYDLLPLALQYDVLGLDMKKSPFLHYCIGEGQGEDLFALRCSILQRICSDVLETELRLYDASPLCFLIDEDLLVQLQSCISISFPNGQSSQMKSWLPLAKSFYCILFNVMKRVPVVYSFLKAVVRGPSPLSIPIMQFYLQKIQDFGEVTLDHFGSGDGRLSDLSELVLDETVFQRVETIATSRFWLDKYCDSLLDYLASGGESILNADISAAIAPGAERTDSLLTGGVAANRRSLSAHICTLVAEFPTCWVGTLLMSASAFADEFVPSMPNDELLALSNALGYVGWYTCQNGHPYVVGNCTYPMETARCSVCNARIGGTNHNTLSGTKRFDPSQRKQCKGYNLTATLPADSYDVQDAHRCGMLTTSVLRYILHLTLVTSMGFGESPAAAVTRFIFPTSTDTAKTYHTLIMLLEQDWAQLKKISKYTDTDLSLALHLTLSDYMKGMRRSSSQGGSLWYCIENNDSRDGFETSFERVCSVYFSKADSLSLVREVAGSLSGLSQYTAIRKCLGEAEAAIYLHRENELSMSKLLKYRLLRYREPVNFEAFNFHFSLNREHANSYPLLAAILKAEEKLSLLGYLTDILAWHRVLFNILKPGSVERGDALYISNADVIARIPEAEREAASMLLNNYCVAFNRTLKLVPFLFECNANPFLASNGEVDLSGSQRGDGTGEKMSPGTSVKFSLPSIVSGEQDATGLCSIQIINALQQTHNEVLEGLLELKRKYDNSNSSPISRTLLATTELINVHVCQFQYAGELQSTGVLRMLPERVQQVPLSASLLNRIQQEVDTRVRLVKLLTQIEECVSFVVSTGNSGVIDVDGNVLLENYICDVLLVPDAVWGEISCPTIASHVHLKHLRALLQALERWLLGDPLDAVVLKYREPYEGVVSPEDIRTVAMAEGCATFTAGLFDLLTEQLSRDTWPADACLKEYVGYRDEDICDVEAYEVFPDTLCLCHAYSVYKFLLSGSCVS
ncbi:unnamed protein product, partial [Ectocarpus fasciculatus]